jgi:hypothetical protein
MSDDGDSTYDDGVKNRVFPFLQGSKDRKVPRRKEKCHQITHKNGIWVQ